MRDAFARLADVVEQLAPLAVAVSGGVDSMTLASAACRVLGSDRMLAVHAVSAAVPADATERVRSQAARDGWPFRVIEAGEFDDPRYRANPVNRCFFCKSNLYDAIRRVTDWQIASGTNTDDLGDYRPGLDAARQRGVRHPYVEAAMDKSAVRDLARTFGLTSIAELPAAPCLSSRVETGLRIEADELRFVNDVERLVGASLAQTGASRAVRCRLRASGVVVELDLGSLQALDASEQAGLAEQIAVGAPARYAGRRVVFAPYKVGSAVLASHHPAGR